MELILIRTTAYCADDQSKPDFDNNDELFACPTLAQSSTKAHVEGRANRTDVLAAASKKCTRLKLCESITTRIVLNILKVTACSRASA
jgi:hypothetical protein